MALPMSSFALRAGERSLGLRSHMECISAVSTATESLSGSNPFITSHSGSGSERERERNCSLTWADNKS